MSDEAANRFREDRSLADHPESVRYWRQLNGESLGALDSIKDRAGSARHMFKRRFGRS